MVDFPEPLAPTMAVNFPAGMERFIFFRTVTVISIEIGGGGRTFWTRGVDEHDIFEFDVALEIFWAFALIGEGIDAWDTVDGLKDLLRCGCRFGENFNPRSDLTESECRQNHRKQNIHDQPDIQFPIRNQSRTLPYLLV